VIAVDIGRLIRREIAQRLRVCCSMQFHRVNNYWLIADLLAYNLIRLLMAQAAAHHGTAPRAISFKHTVQLWSEFSARSALHNANRAQSIEMLLRLIAQVPAGHRTHRSEPRARKRRPKSFPWLKVPRHVARQRPAHVPNGLRAIDPA